MTLNANHFFCHILTEASRTQRLYIHITTGFAGLLLYVPRCQRVLARMIEHTQESVWSGARLRGKVDVNWNGWLGLIQWVSYMGQNNHRVRQINMPHSIALQLICIAEAFLRITNLLSDCGSGEEKQASRQIWQTECQDISRNPKDYEIFGKPSSLQIHRQSIATSATPDATSITLI